MRLLLAIIAFTIISFAQSQYPDAIILKSGTRIDSIKVLEQNSEYVKFIKLGEEKETKIGTKQVQQILKFAIAGDDKQAIKEMTMDERLALLEKKLEQTSTDASVSKYILIVWSAVSVIALAIMGIQLSK